MHSTSVMGTTKNMAIQTRPFDVAPVPWPRNAAGSHMAGNVVLMPSNWPKKKTLVEWCVEMRQVPWGEMKGNEWYIRWDVVVPFQNFQNLGWPLTCLGNLIFQEIPSQTGRGCTSEVRTCLQTFCLYFAAKPHTLKWGMYTLELFPYYLSSHWHQVRFAQRCFMPVSRRNFFYFVASPSC